MSQEKSVAQICLNSLILLTNISKWEDNYKMLTIINDFLKITLKIASIQMSFFLLSWKIEFYLSREGHVPFNIKKTSFYFLPTWTINPSNLGLLKVHFLFQINLMNRIDSANEIPKFQW